MSKTKSFGQILREQHKRIQENMRLEADLAIEVSAANPPTLELMPLTLDYDALISDKGLSGEEETFVCAIRAMDMVLNVKSFPQTSALLAITNIFDIHILPRLDTPYPDRYGMAVIVLLEQAMERNKDKNILKQTAFTNCIKAVEARLSYGLGTVRNDT